MTSSLAVQEFHSTFLEMHQKMSRSLSGGLLLWDWSIAFWILPNPLYLRSRQSKSLGFMKNCKPTVGTGQQKGPNSSLLKSLESQGKTNKDKRSGIQAMPPSPSLLDLLPTSYHLLKHFDINPSAGKNASSTSRKWNALQESYNSKTYFLYSRN